MRVRIPIEEVDELKDGDKLEMADGSFSYVGDVRQGKKGDESIWSEWRTHGRDCCATDVGPSTTTPAFRVVAVHREQEEPEALPYF